MINGQTFTAVERDGGVVLEATVAGDVAADSYLTGDYATGYTQTNAEFTKVTISGGKWTAGKSYVINGQTFTAVKSGKTVVLEATVDGNVAADSYLVDDYAAYTQTNTEFTVVTISGGNWVINDKANDTVNALLGSAPVLAGEDWVGLGDAKDCFLLDNTAGTGYYNLTFDDLQNDLKVVVYEYDATGTKLTQKAVKSATIKAGSTNWSLSNLLLDDSKTYYVMVQATKTDGTKDTTYSWVLSQTDAFDVDLADNTRATAAALTVGTTYTNWVGYKDNKDCYTFTADGKAVDFTLTLGDSVNGNVTLKIIDSVTNKQVGSTLTVSSKTTTLSTGDLALINGRAYYVEVAATSANSKGQSSDYTLSSSSWNYDDKRTADSVTVVNKVATGTNVTELEFGKAYSSAVWHNATDADNVDWYKFSNLNANDNFTLTLSNINGNNIKVSIGYYDAKGKFQVVQSATGKAGASMLQFSRALSNGDYYIKIETSGNNRASEYTLKLTDNNKLAGFNTGDNTWKQVAANVNAVLYQTDTVDLNGNPIDNDNVITDWVGFGDTVDVFKVKTDENGQLIFRDATGSALEDQDVKLALVDVNGKAISLTFDKNTGEYTTKVNLMADAEYYLSVTSSKPKEKNTDYSIAIDKKLP